LSISPDGGGRGLLGIMDDPGVVDGVLRREVADVEVEGVCERKDEEENEVEVDADLVESDDEDPDERRWISVSRSTTQSCSSIKANRASSDSVSWGSSGGLPSALASSSLAPSCLEESGSALPAIVRMSARRSRDKSKSGVAVAVGFAKSGLVGWGSWASRVT